MRKSKKSKSGSKRTAARRRADKLYHRKWRKQVKIQRAMNKLYVKVHRNRNKPDIVKVHPGWLTIPKPTEPSVTSAPAKAKRPYHRKVHRGARRLSSLGKIQVSRKNAKADPLLGLVESLCFAFGTGLFLALLNACALQ